MTAAEFWPKYYKDDPNFPPSQAACEFAEAYARARVEQLESELRRVLGKTAEHIIRSTNAARESLAKE